MNILSIILIIAALVIGFIISKIMLQGKAQAIQAVADEKEKSFLQKIAQIEHEIAKKEVQINQIRTEKEAIDKQLTIKEVDFENLWERNKEQKEEINKIQEKFTKEFENLANKILEEKSIKFTEQNKENLKNILTPLNEKIQLFERKVEDSQKENIGLHAALKEQLFNLQNQNLKITKEAENLTKALKGDSKMQGNWGELVLEKVLEKSGLEKDREYFVQQSFITDENTRVQPDIVINLPDGKKMIVDSKVSLTAFEKFINEEDDVLKTNHLKEHLNSIKRHIDQLSDKNYFEVFRDESPNFVLLFIPMEPAFAVAINEDNSLYSKALERNIVIVTPSTLLATLRTISSMWSNQKQQENALEIAKQAGALYDKFEGFVQDLIKIGKKMDEAKAEYGSAMNKLIDGNGNIIVSIEKLKKMGAKAKKSLPESVLQRANTNTIDFIEE